MAAANLHLGFLPSIACLVFCRIESIWVESAPSWLDFDQDPVPHQLKHFCLSCLPGPNPICQCNHLRLNRFALLKVAPWPRCRDDFGRQSFKNMEPGNHWIGIASSPKPSCVNMVNAGKLTWGIVAWSCLNATLASKSLQLSDLGVWLSPGWAKDLQHPKSSRGRQGTQLVAVCLW